MEWYSGLYLGDSLEGKKEKLIREITEGRYDNSLYLVTLAYNGRDLLDIRRVSSLVREGLRDELPMIVGLAKGRRESVKVVERIIQDCLAGTGDVDLRSFLA